MKIIHCADLHLDSKLNTNLSPEQASDRRMEMLSNFTKMVEYAVKNGVKVILIAGDLFDNEQISEYARSQVVQTIYSHPQIVFFYVTGNHEKQGFVRYLPAVPKNLKLFRDTFTSFRFHGGEVTISGMNPGPGYRDELYEKIHLAKESFNIVMLHGQITDYRSPDSEEDCICLKDLAYKNIDYLALGHVHSFMEGAIDARGTYVYSGCLEGRGFDEVGEHGFVLMDLDIENRSATYELIPWGTRRVHEVKMNVSNVRSLSQIIADAERTISMEAEPEDMVMLTLTGEVEPGYAIDTNVIAKRFEKKYYAVRIVDDTEERRNPEEFNEERSLKGEFVRLVKLQQDLSEEDREAILRMGILSLQGEEVRP